MMLTVTLLPFWKICSKAGFPGWISLAILVPLLNIGLLFFLAFAEWPALRPSVNHDHTKHWLTTLRRGKRKLLNTENYLSALGDRSIRRAVTMVGDHFSSLWPLGVHSDIYDPSVVQKLFDEMSATYAHVNMIASFRFARRWRRRCVRQIEFAAGYKVVDLMTGMGELCPDISRQIGPSGHITAIDLSPVMCQKARRFEEGPLPCSVDVIQGNALCSDLPNECCDGAISSFGLKTFSPAQIEQLAREVHRILKPSGVFSFVEISVPPSRWLRRPYLFYLERLIPIIGWLLKGNPENYRMLGIYTGGHTVASAFQSAGLETSEKSFFFGCATGLVGRKPHE